jgi:hypothetical protein
MRRGSWTVLLWLPLVAVLTIGIAWGAKNAWIFDHGWIPPLAWLLGIVLLAIGRPRVREQEAIQIWRSQSAWVMFGYSIALGLLEPMLVAQRNHQYSPWFVLLLVPVAWVAVIGFGRSEWRRSLGAWLVLYSQFFALIYNITHLTSGIGCWSGWVY